MNLQLPFDKTISLINTIPSDTCKSAIEKHWKPYFVYPDGQNGIHGSMKAQAFCWLYCWAMTGMNSDTAREKSEEVFCNIFGGPFNKYPQERDGHFHEWARKIRNERENNNFESEILSMLNLIPEQQNKEAKMDNYLKLLKNNKNLILTGAPGTGKTYLARQIAIQWLFSKNSEDELTDDQQKLFREHFGFVQFHPSYDYTDFVEGLRPTRENIGFKLEDGIFKRFCKKAAAKYRIEGDSFDEAYMRFISDLQDRESPIRLKTKAQNKEFSLTYNNNYSCVAIPATGEKTEMVLTKERIKNYLENRIIPFYKPYLTAVAGYFKDTYSPKIDTQDSLPYIFVIDEINRGEISKIFGEIFFSIDPGYRGEKGKVTTQYSNLIEDDDPFKDGFYIPENVYIIGTMNDIDRSVESFDFAMRRRFVWQEVKAEDSAKNMELEKKLDKASVDKMAALNKVIENTEGLGRHYQIGAAYFLNLEKYKLPDGKYDEKTYEKLWDLHLKPLLNEYVRALPKPKEQLDKLEKAYKEPMSNAS